MAEDFVTMGEAQEILGVSNFKMWQMVKDGRLATFRSDIDRRKKLIRRSDLEGLQAPQPVVSDDPWKKAAA